MLFTFTHLIPNTNERLAQRLEAPAVPAQVTGSTPAIASFFVFFFVREKTFAVSAPVSFRVSA